MTGCEMIQSFLKKHGIHTPFLCLKQNESTTFLPCIIAYNNQVSKTKQVQKYQIILNVFVCTKSRIKDQKFNKLAFEVK